MGRPEEYLTLAIGNGAGESGTHLSLDAFLVPEIQYRFDQALMASWYAVNLRTLITPVSKIRYWPLIP